MTARAELRLEGVDIVRGGRLLISGLTLNVTGPKLLWVTGGNGVGKTSLLRSCAGLSRPASGRIGWRLEGQAVSAPQIVSFLPTDSFAKTGLFARESAGFWSGSLEKVSLTPHARTETDALSTGQRKRLCFANAMDHAKPIWILDEPLAGLDADGRAMIATALRKHVEHGGLALVASHAPIAVGDVPTQRLVIG